ncbi:diaminopimelate epimerase [Campylobacter sp. VBCF_06 NA8]|uniref:diaminopimelate epimerase n=1 Tax=Campylobacter sp. VBCF_06 NA8 TaxID=2983822 RepID=UPI0022E9D019|nr:diaminopimelate epimerase [Campylobacter sp. VBCF_06 NA8]MDA3045716.1 diaminopimelate epimerase [Campylobacter sp. VBCF_06 NA8]
MNFSKYNACGNDFVVVEFSQSAERGSLARVLCNRAEGIGANGFISLSNQKTPGSNDNNIIVEFYNPDGTRSPISANAAMVVCMYAYERFLSGKNVKFKNDANVINGEIRGFDTGRSVSFGTKKRDSNFGQIYGMGSNRAITANVEVEFDNVNRLGEGFMSNGHMWYLYEVGMPNVVTFVKDLSAYNHTLATELSEKFNANVSYAEMSSTGVRVRTYAHGAKKEVLSCGTGIASAYIAGRAHYNLSENANMACVSGEKIGVKMRGETACISGDVRHLFDGDFIA